MNGVQFEIIFESTSAWTPIVYILIMLFVLGFFIFCGAKKIPVGKGIAAGVLSVGLIAAAMSFISLLPKNTYTAYSDTIKEELIPSLEEKYQVELEPEGPALEALRGVNFYKGSDRDGPFASERFDVMKNDKFVSVFVETNGEGVVTMKEITSDGTIKDLNSKE